MCYRRIPGEARLVHVPDGDPGTVTGRESRRPERGRLALGGNFDRNAE